jgi:CRP/FNR family transcriptional regulator, cyclic AMP receptor protein
MLLKAVEFSRLGADVRDDLFAAATTRSYDNNQFVYLQDDEAEALYLIVSGHVRLSYLMEDGSAVLFAILPPGEIFGELGIFEGDRHCDMATAVGTACVAGVSARNFRALSAKHPELGAALGLLVARRYRSYIELTRNLSLKTLSARLAQSVLRLADGLGTRATINGRGVASVGAIVTQTDLGLMARGARGNVNRILKAWEKEGWISIRDRSILILDRAKLETLWTEEGLL